MLQAGVIIGSGSASFEMLRYLTERLPVMVTPRWVRSLVQPIAVRDVLVVPGRCPSTSHAGTNRRFDIAGPDILTYRDMMQRYAAVAGLPRRVIIPVPVLTPWLSSQWVNVVTPVPKAIAQPLVESLRNNVVAHEHDIEALDPARAVPVRRGGPARARTDPSRRRDDPLVRSLVAGRTEQPDADRPRWSGGTAYRDDRRRRRRPRRRPVVGDRGHRRRPGVVLVPVGLGGPRPAGPHGRWRRPATGRRDPDRLVVGDVVDFWRVEAHRAAAAAAAASRDATAGEAWLEFSVTDQDDGTPVLHQNALFIPRGLPGHLYWWAVSPFHGVVFGSMIANLAKAAIARQPGRLPTPASDAGRR